MNDKKLNELFAAAKQAPAPAPAPTEGFDLLVMQAVRREPPGSAATPTFAEQLDALFPRLAWAAVAAIVLFIAVDVMTDGLSEGITTVAQQWMLI